LPFCYDSDTKSFPGDASGERLADSQLSPSFREEGPQPLRLVDPPLASTGEGKSDRLLEIATPLLIACVPLLWLALFDRTFRPGVWSSDLWMVGYTGEYLRQHWSLPLTLNTDQLVGLPFPIFYGTLFHPIAGIVSLFLGAAVAMRVVLVALFWLQTTQIIKLIRTVHADRYVAWAIAALLALGVYSLGNLYHRGAIAELAAVSLLVSALSAWIRAIYAHNPRSRSTLASLAWFLLVLCAGAHPMTALLGSIAFGFLFLASLSIVPDRLWIARIVRHALLFLIVLSPWLYAVLKFRHDVAVSHALMKVDRAATFETPGVLHGTELAGERKFLTQLPPAFRGLHDYVDVAGLAPIFPSLEETQPLSSTTSNGSQGGAFGLHLLVTLLPANGPHFGEVQDTTVSAPRPQLVVTNVQSFPWNKLVVDGNELPSGGTYFSPQGTLATPWFPNQRVLGYRFTPDVLYCQLRFISLALCFTWGAIVLCAALFEAGGSPAILERLIVRAERFEVLSVHTAYRTGRRIVAPIHGFAVGQIALLLPVVRQIALPFLVDTSHARRLRGFIVGLVALLCLIGTSQAVRVGDGDQYVALALRLSALQAPAMYPYEVQAIKSTMGSLGHGFGGLQVDSVTGRDGRGDLPHFWFYSMLAVPEVWLLEAAGAVATAGWRRTAGWRDSAVASDLWLLETVGTEPSYAFTLLNMGLMLSALWVVSAYLDWPALMIIFASPVIWWIDKAHTEVFTFSLMAIAMTLMVEQPWWALVSAAIASTQNLPIVLTLPVIALTAIAVRPSRLRDWRLYLGGAAAAAIAAISPLYYETRLHTPSLLSNIGAARMLWPSPARLLLFLCDPNFGLIVWCPILAGTVAVTATALIARKPRPRSLLLLLASAVIAVIFMFAFAQTNNLNSGGTFGMARYAVWFIPLAIPALALGQAAFGPSFKRRLAMVAVIAAIWSVSVAHPGRREEFLRPTWLADRIWTHYPSINNPFPEVFYERIARMEQGPLVPVATGNCAKILLVGGVAPTGCAAPVSLASADESIKAYCRTPSALCYENRRGAIYELVEAPD
jgi:hypothetical protein